MSEALLDLRELHTAGLLRGVRELQFSREDFVRLRIPSDVDHVLGYRLHLNPVLPEHVVAFVGRDRQLLGWVDLRSGLMHMRRLYAPEVR